MGRRNRKGHKEDDEDNGFAAWGGYMNAKKAKLSEQFNLAVGKLVERRSDVFKGVSIFVNGYTKPSADELKLLMAEHGGSYHLYQNQSGPTTHIIASNLPNVKINQLGNIPIIKPDWIVDSIAENRLLDYSKYLLYTNYSRTQPRLNFAPDDQQKSKQPSLTASDPKFLSEFYNNSRLHLISTLGAEFKQLVNDLREKSSGAFPGKEKLIVNTSSHVQSKISMASSFPVIMHIDMDCFFVSVGLRQRPELRGKPVAVTHSRGGPSRTNVDRQAEIDLYMKRLPEGAITRLEQIDNNCSMSEIASCSYEARRCGVKNGMFLGTALKLCPELVPVPYDFQGYRDVSSMLYKTIAEYTLDIEAVSCDEMYVDITKVLQETGLGILDWADHIRSEILSITGCPCSTGFGANRLQARLATRKAKPMGQYYLETADVEEYMRDLPLEDLPGVGRATLTKLNSMGLKTCGDVQLKSLSLLRTELGQKAGETIYEQAKGLDRRPLSFEHERKSVSAEINYGIRFKSHDEALTFIESLANEVHSRLLETKMSGAKCVTLKLMVRAEEAPKETAKFLGHGICDSLSRSTTMARPINDAKVIYREAKNLYGRLNVVAEDLRGVGIQLSRLEKCSTTNSALTRFLNKSETKSNSDQEKCSTTNSALTRTPITSEAKSNSDQAVSITSDAESNKPRSEKTVEPKQGRPKGMKKSIQGAMGLTNYFNSNKPLTFKEKDVVDKSPSAGAKIDLNVLKELPEDLRDEIVKEYNLHDSEKATPTTSKNDEYIASAVEKKKKGFADLSHDQLKSLLRNWLKNEEVPRDLDVEMLGDYLKNLALERMTSKLHQLVNFLHRNTNKLNCAWHDAYFKIMNYVQEGMVARYGSTLQIPHTFQCSEHSCVI